MPEHAHFVTNRFYHFLLIKLFLPYLCSFRFCSFCSFCSFYSFSEYGEDALPAHLTQSTSDDDMFPNDDDDEDPWKRSEKERVLFEEIFPSASTVSKKTNSNQVRPNSPKVTFPQSTFGYMIKFSFFIDQVSYLYEIE